MIICMLGFKKKWYKEKVDLNNFKIEWGLVFSLFGVFNILKYNR